MKKDPDAKWKAQSDLRTLTEAHEIKMDRKRHSNAQKEAKAQMKALSSVNEKKMKNRMKDNEKGMYR